LVVTSLERVEPTNGGSRPVFEVVDVAERGIRILEEAADADVVLFAVEDDALPGEASHVLAAYPDVKVIGLDPLARVRLMLGSVTKPLGHDLSTVIRWVVESGAAARAVEGSCRPGGGR
jgi:hypothetical protein